MRSCLPAVAASSVVLPGKAQAGCCSGQSSLTLLHPAPPLPTQRLGSSGVCMRRSGRAAPLNSWGQRTLPLLLQQQLASRLAPQPPLPLHLATQPTAAVLPCWVPPPPMPRHPGQLPPVLGPPQMPPSLAHGRGVAARCRLRIWREMDLASQTSI